MEIKPGSEKVVQARLEKGYKQNFGSPGILKESQDQKGKGEICIARSLVVPRAGENPIRLANFTDKPIRVPSNRPIAEYHPLSSTGGIKLCQSRLIQVEQVTLVLQMDGTWKVLV